MPGKDPDHWLYRLSPEEWLSAAEGELVRARQALANKQHRQGVAGARRAAGMAWNAVLYLSVDDAYGRSYMDHLKALGEDATIPDTVRRVSLALVGAPLQTQIVQLGPGDTSLADAAEVIVAHARERVAPTASA